MRFKSPLTCFTGISEEQLAKRIKTLTSRELKYFKIMLSKSGVLYITSKPGIAKSAIVKSIADKLGFAFMDIRLSMVDETDVGLYPKEGIVTVNGVEYDILKHVVPEWAFLSNEKPTIIFFEELNRSQASVRNAALQILLERSIGFKFHFNDNVLMVASGNMGEEDGTDVEEFDAALNNRLIHVNHDLEIREWVDGFAYFNIHPTITSFIENNTEYFYKYVEKEGKMQAYATPRSWTFLSDYINTNYPPVQQKDKDGNLLFVNRKGKVSTEQGEGYEPKMIFAPIEQWLQDIKENGYSFVGTTISRFCRYCEDTIKLSINDILNNFHEVKKDLLTFNRDKHSELLNSLKGMNFFEFTDVQVENIILFLTATRGDKNNKVKIISDDESLSYLLYILDDHFLLNDSNAEHEKKVMKFMKDPRLERYYKSALDHCLKE